MIIVVIATIKLRNGNEKSDLVEFLDDNIYYGRKYKVIIEIVEEK